MREARLIINGESSDAAGKATFNRVDPLSGEVATRAAAATPADARQAVAAAAAAFPAWSRSTPVERRALLHKAAARLREKLPDFVAACVSETGCTTGWVHFNVELAAEHIEEAAAITTQINGETYPSNHAGTIAMSVRQPAGVVLGLAPWNAPIVLGARAIAVPLACGNTVVLKGSEISPRTHELIAAAFNEAGFPKGVVNYICHAAADAPQVVETMIADRAVRRVNFTGSTKVGRIIGEMCARHIKPAVLELGGKTPLIILDDADLDGAVAASIFGAFMHQGQICMSTERIIVDQKVADAFIARFKAKAEALSVGDPRKGNVALGAVVDKSTIERTKALIDDAVSKGAVLVTGGSVDGLVMKPAVVDKVTPAMKLFYEESFGPLVAVVRANDTADAVRLANDSEYGLSAAVHGKDIGRAMEVAQQIDSGICHINGPTVQDQPHMPFGGTKLSGIGRFGGAAGIAEFTDLRLITIDVHPRRYPI